VRAAALAPALTVEVEQDGQQLLAPRLRAHALPLRLVQRLELLELAPEVLAVAAAQAAQVLVPRAAGDIDEGAHVRAPGLQATTGSAQRTRQGRRVARRETRLPQVEERAGAAQMVCQAGDDI